MPKGDAPKAKADLLDGFARVAWVLLEALASAPLSGAEFQVVMFILRRTYGWANKTNPDRGKVDVMTAKDVAVGTGLRKRTAEEALGTLVRENVVCRIPLEEHPGSLCAYGINTNTFEWYGGPEWRDARVSLKQAREVGSYTQNTVVPVPEKVYWLYGKKCGSHTEKSVLVGATNPTGTVADDTPTDSITEKDDREGNDSTKLPPPTDPPAPPLPPSNERGCKRSDGPMLLQNYACLATAVRQVYGGHWSQTKQNDFVCDAGAALAEPGCTVTEDDAIAALLGDGKPTPGQRGDWWVGNLCKAKATRASPTRRGRSPSAPAAPEKFAAAVEELGLEVEPDATDPLADE